MKFCPLCSSVMTKTATPTGTIIFHCRCQNTIDGGPDDTLMAEGFLETAESNLKHEVFREQSPFDPAANIILKDCPQCGLNFLAVIRIGNRETSEYSCSCGFSATHDDYMKVINAKAPEKGPEKGKEKAN
jgi:DNA-directed RNA polymerase subunit M/transcription elongation factor TFIIS